jgi:hypothetical protein
MEEKTVPNITPLIVGKTETGKDIFFTPGKFSEVFYAQKDM